MPDPTKTAPASSSKIIPLVLAAGSWYLLSSVGDGRLQVTPVDSAPATVAVQQPTVTVDVVAPKTDGLQAEREKLSAKIEEAEAIVAELMALKAKSLEAAAGPLKPTVKDPLDAISDSLKAIDLEPRRNTGLPPAGPLQPSRRQPTAPDPSLLPSPSVMYAQPNARCLTRRCR